MIPSVTPNSNQDISIEKIKLLLPQIQEKILLSLQGVKERMSTQVSECRSQLREILDENKITWVPFDLELYIEKFREREWEILAFFKYLLKELQPWTPVLLDRGQSQLRNDIKSHPEFQKINRKNHELNSLNTLIKSTELETIFELSSWKKMGREKWRDPYGYVTSEGEMEIQTWYTGENALGDINRTLFGNAYRGEITKIEEM